MKMRLTTTLPVDLIEPAMTHFCEEGNKKSLGTSKSFWTKEAEGSYIVQIDYLLENSKSNRVLRGSLEHGLHKKDPAGKVEILEEKKDAKILEKNKVGSSGKNLRPTGKMVVPKHKGDLLTANKVKQFEHFMNKDCKHKCYLCESCVLEIKKILGDKKEKEAW